MPPLVILPALLTLYKLDRDLHTLQVGLDGVQKDQKAQAAKIAALTKSADTQDAALKKLQAEIAIKDLDLKTRQEHIEKMRESLNLTKTNKDYSAILVTISGEKAEVSKLEGVVLEQMQIAETNQKALDAIRQQIATETETLKQIEAGQGEKVNALLGQINAVKARRAEAAKTVPAEALREYDRVSQKYPGDAMATIDYEENDLDTVTCGSCYMGLNVEHLNALRGRDAIRRCNSCGRILYLADMVTVEQHVSQG
jgi:uncharacterized protein